MAVPAAIACNELPENPKHCNVVLCGETCPVTVKVLPRTGPVEFYLVPAIDLLDCPDYSRVCFSFASGFKDFWFFRTRREQ